MSYYDIRYQKGLEAYYKRVKQLGGSDAFEKYIEMYTKLKPIAPFTKSAFMDILGVDRDGRVGSRLLNGFATAVYMDSKVTSAMLRQLIRSIWYSGTVKDITRDFLVSAIAHMNDSQRKVHGEYIEIPFVPYLNSTVATGYSTPNFSTVKIDVRKVCDYDVRIGAYDGNVERGGIQGVVDGTGITIVSEYNMTGQNITLEITPRENANLMVLEFNDDIEHIITIDGQTVVVAGACVLKDNFSDPFKIQIRTLDYKRMGNKQYITSVKKLSFYDASIDDSQLGVVSTCETEPLKTDVVKRGIYSGDGNVLFDVKQGEWKRLGTVVMDTVHAKPLELSKDSKGFVVQATSSFSPVTDLDNPVDYSKLAIYGKYDETKGYQTGYVNADGYKWSYAYLTDMPDNADGVYDLFGQEVEEIDENNIYLLKWSDTKPNVNIYSHIAPPENIDDSGVEIPLHVQKTLSFSDYDVNDFTPDYNFDMPLQKPVVYATKTVGEYEQTDSGFSFSLDTAVKQGYVSTRNFTGIVSLKDDEGYEVLGPDKVNVGEPIKEDPNESVYPLINVVYDGSLEGKTITAHIYDITDFNTRTIDSEGLSFNVDFENYQAGVKILAVSGTPREITTTIDGQEFDDVFDKPKAGSHRIVVSSSDSFECDALLVIPFNPSYLYSEEVNYEPGYVIDDVGDDSGSFDTSLYSYMQDGSEVETVTEGSFKVNIIGTVSQSSKITFERGSSDEGVMVYSKNGHSIDGVRLTLQTNEDGFQPVVTVPRLKYTLRW